MTKPRVRGEIRVKAYPLMADAIEVGLVLGWNRAHKHVDDPDPDTIREAQHRAIMSELDERFTFDED